MRKDWFRFLVGLLFLTVAICFFASGYSPPGLLGEVLRHNQENDIDASPLLYMDVEHMSELEDGVRELRKRAGVRRQNESDNTSDKISENEALLKTKEKEN